MFRHDQQVMRALSDNMQSNKYFLSTPKLVSDLLFISETLVPLEREVRNEALGEMLAGVNLSLPSDVYIPIVSLDWKKDKKRSLKK